MNRCLLIKGSRVRVPPGSPELADSIESSDFFGQLDTRSEPLIGSESSTHSPFFHLAGLVRPSPLRFTDSESAEVFCVQ